MNKDFPVLAIDYGDKNFGIAISDNKGIIASPLTVLRITKNRNIDNILTEIRAIVVHNNIQRIVVGKPQIFQDSYKQSAKKIDKFCIKLKKIVNIPIIFQDESYSTTQAQNMLTSLGQSTKRSRDKIDMISATVFLQDFLNSENK